MSVLPVGGAELTNAVAVSYPSRTWAIVNGRITGEVDGYAAMRQAVDIILRTERYRWQIYLQSSGVEYRGLIGNDPGYVATELLRRVMGALSMDDRYAGVKDYQYSYADGVLTVKFTVLTAFGEVYEQMEVSV